MTPINLGPDPLKYGLVGLAAVVIITLAWKIPKNSIWGLAVVVAGALVLALSAMFLQTGTDRQASEKESQLERTVAQCQGEIDTVKQLLIAKMSAATTADAAKEIARQAAALLDSTKCKLVDAAPTSTSTP